MLSLDALEERLGYRLPLPPDVQPALALRPRTAHPLLDADELVQLLLARHTAPPAAEPPQPQQEGQTNLASQLTCGNFERFEREEEFNRSVADDCAKAALQQAGPRGPAALPLAKQPFNDAMITCRLLNSAMTLPMQPIHVAQRAQDQAAAGRSRNPSAGVASSAAASPTASPTRTRRPIGAAAGAAHAFSPGSLANLLLDLVPKGAAGGASSSMLPSPTAAAAVAALAASKGSNTASAKLLTRMQHLPPASAQAAAAAKSTTALGALHSLATISDAALQPASPSSPISSVASRALLGMGATADLPPVPATISLAAKRPLSSISSGDAASAAPAAEKRARASPHSSPLKAAPAASPTKRKPPVASVARELAALAGHAV